MIRRGRSEGRPVSVWNRFAAAVWGRQGGGLPGEKKQYDVANNRNNECNGRAVRGRERRAWENEEAAKVVLITTGNQSIACLHEGMGKEGFSGSRKKESERRGTCDSSEWPEGGNPAGRSRTTESRSRSRSRSGKGDPRARGGLAQAQPKSLDEKSSTGQWLSCLPPRTYGHEFKRQ